MHGLMKEYNSSVAEKNAISKEIVLIHKALKQILDCFSECLWLECAQQHNHSGSHAACPNYQCADPYLLQVTLVFTK